MRARGLILLGIFIACGLSFNDSQASTRNHFVSARSVGRSGMRSEGRVNGGLRSYGTPRLTGLNRKKFGNVNSLGEHLLTPDGTFSVKATTSKSTRSSTKTSGYTYRPVSLRLGDRTVNAIRTPHMPRAGSAPGMAQCHNPCNPYWPTAPAIVIPGAQ